MESIMLVGLAGAGLAAIAAGVAWAKRQKLAAVASPQNRPAEHPYETPADRFMVWPADPLIRAAPKRMALVATQIELPSRVIERHKEVREQL